MHFPRVKPPRVAVCSYAHIRPLQEVNPDFPKLSAPPKTLHPEDERLRALADLELVRGSLVGNTKDISQLMGRLECVSSMVSAKNLRMGRPLDAAEVEDVVQEALICIWNKRESFLGSGPLEPWIYRICTLEYMNRMRKKLRRVRLVREIEPMGEAAAACPAAATKADYSPIYAGLDSVGPPDADVVRLKHFEALTFDQIGVRLSIPANTAKTQYYRGLEKLRRHLGSNYFG